MAKLTGLGELERAVMDHLWDAATPQTVRQVHEALATRRELAYTTVMTVLDRLAKKHRVTRTMAGRALRRAISQNPRPPTRAWVAKRTSSGAW